MVNTDCGLSERTAIVMRICDRTNEVLEYVFGLESSRVDAPAQSNIDERMPLRYLRPCAEMINTIILTQDLEIPLVAVPGNSMDYHGFVPLTRTLSEALNKIVDQL
jgi:hypothetical protein